MTHSVNPTAFACDRIKLIMEIREELKKKILDVLKDLNVEEKDVNFASDISHGDFSTNISLTAFHKLREKFKNPQELAEHIVKQLQKNVPNYIKKVEVLPPGFINFWFHEKYLLENLEKIDSLKDQYGKGQRLKDKRVMLEFADPNPFKEFHIGHLRNISLGESFARLLEFSGGEVWRANYQGDVGLHVAKALWGIKNLIHSTSSGQEFKIKNLTAKDLGEAYARGAKAYEEDKKAKKEIEDINLKIYRKSDPSLNKLWEEGRRWSLEHFEEIYKRVGTKYKKYYFESEVEEPGRNLVLSHLGGGIFERHEGAVVFRGSHTRVFVTSDEYGTYEAKDLGLAKLKYEDFPYDLSIIITASEQEAYFKVVLEAMGKVLPELRKKTIHDYFGFVKLKEGKMSSRKGDVIEGEWLMLEAKRHLKENFSEMDEKTLEKVAVGAVKYSMLKFSRKSDITFSFEESIDLSGNSGPYIQYAYARTQSVRAKVKSQKSKVKSLGQNSKLEKEELLVLRLLIHFPEIAKEAEESFAPNLVCNYLFELSQAFNNFYQKHKIIGSENEDFRLNLTSAVGQILKTGLYLLGIEAPEKM